MCPACRRLTIGVELAAKPELLLFHNERTSGLDDQSAYNIIRFLRKFTAAGPKIICTIHQPNALLFQSFDRLLLLQRGGECVYFGDGSDAHVLVEYLERHGAKVPGDANVAEFMLEAIGAGSRNRIGGDRREVAQVARVCRGQGGDQETQGGGARPTRWSRSASVESTPRSFGSSSRRCSRGVSGRVASLHGIAC
jgi:ABC-type multidrug transport system ATPase subunit